MSVKTYLKEIAIALDQLANTILGGHCDETLSSRCYRNAKKYWYAELAKIILDFLFLPFGKNHCEESYKSELNRNHLPEGMR